MTKSNYTFFQSLYDKYKEKGFEIAAFPCNQFGGQEPWKEDEIKKWVTENFKVSFDLYSKINVKGKDIDPLFEYLTNCDANKGMEIQWNFDGKFLINTNGECIQRWNRKEPLDSIEAFIAKMIDN